MSDTPRTDKEIVGELLVFASFARKLERELAAVTEQRDRLAEALRDVMKYRRGEKPYDYWRLNENDRGNAQFDGWNEIEDRINEALAAVEGGKP